MTRKVKFIEGQPMPAKRAFVTPKSSKYPWNEMPVGAFFYFEGRNNKSAYQTAHQASQKYAPKKFRARTLENGKMGIWRES